MNWRKAIFYCVMYVCSVQLIVNPRKSEETQDTDVKLNNPLSQAEESPWNRFFQDNELRLTIKQDVIRT